MPNSDLFGWAGAPATPPQMPDFFALRKLAQRLMPMNRVRELYQRAQHPADRPLMENLLREMRVEYRLADADLDRIPATGPLLVTANHPFGLLDGAILASVLGRVRGDVKILTNHLLASIPELQPHCVFLDPLGGNEAVVRNRRGLREAVAWLKSGGVLVMFPAGEVSHLQLRQLQVADSAWSATAARLILATGATALPVYIQGRNSASFQAMGMVHPNLRTARLLTEFLQQAGKRVEVRVGSPISVGVVRHARNHELAANYLRWRAYLLAERDRTEPDLAAALKAMLPRKKQEPIAAAVLPSLLQREIESLPRESCLEQNKEFLVYLASAQEIPHMMHEIGRLRELTFRAVGEGTGASRDIDRFDQHYKHLLLWSRTKQELAGAYRLGLTPEILTAMGMDGLYTNTLFRYDPDFFKRLGPALELGRTFIRTEYQRHYGPLLTMWKGIGRFLARNPQFAVLFGAVSMSSRYSQASRELIVRFFQAQEMRLSLTSNLDLRKLVTPRSPFRPRALNSPGADPACDQFANLQDLAGPIADVESDGKSVPILYKQYAKLGGRLVSFNVDRNFSGVLDGFVLVDVRRSNPTVLGRYMGQDGLAAFQRYHDMARADLMTDSVMPEPALSAF